MLSGTVATIPMLFLGGVVLAMRKDVVLSLVLLAFVPLALCILLRRRIVTEQRMGRWSLLFLLVVCLLFGGIGSGLARWGTYHDAYTYNFTTDTGVTHFGLNASVRLAACSLSNCPPYSM